MEEALKKRSVWKVSAFVGIALLFNALADSEARNTMGIFLTNTTQSFNQTVYAGPAVKQEPFVSKFSDEDNAAKFNVQTPNVIMSIFSVSCKNCPEISPMQIQKNLPACEIPVCSF